MQSGTFDQEEDYIGEDEMVQLSANLGVILTKMRLQMYPKIESRLLVLKSTVYEIGVRDAQSEQTLLKTVAEGTYDQHDVIMVQISGTCSPKIKRKVTQTIPCRCPP
jgi:hypothetical protein